MTATSAAVRADSHCSKLTAAALACLLTLAALATAFAGGAKSGDTPCFWQRDPEADFENEGRNHCAPVSVAAGLVYLASARGFEDLVQGTEHDDQVALITDLAEEMATDPTEGTNPDKILTGLRSYAKRQGYSFERLELATWRGVSAPNKKYLIATKPGLRWINAAAADEDTVTVLNFGWYKEGDDGTYTRHGGHWVNVVGAGSQARQLHVHNPMLKPERQKTATRIGLTLLDEDFVVTNGSGEETEMSGYYAAEGPGLPFNMEQIAAAVLDAVIVFKFKSD